MNKSKGLWQYRSSDVMLIEKTYFMPIENDYCAYYVIKLPYGIMEGITDLTIECPMYISSDFDTLEQARKHALNTAKEFIKMANWDYDKVYKVFREDL